MKNIPFLLLFVVLVISSGRAHAGPGAVAREEYLAYCIAAAEDGWANLEANRERWYRSIDLNYVFGYNPPANDPYLAALCINLYELTGERKYLGWAKELLLYYANYKRAYPADFHTRFPEYGKGLPALPNIFSFPKYVHAYARLKKAVALTTAEKSTIERNIAESADVVTNFQEWGAMNRALLRAEVLLYAAKELPDHPRSPVWRMMGNAIAGDNWGQWEIEDATGYHAVWVYSLLGLASDVREDERLYRTPVLHYYFDYFLALMCPAGVLPDFGDSNWGSGWDRFLPFFEKGAAVYRDARLRWAAAQMFRKYLDPLPRQKSVFLALVLSDACRWADFSLPAEAPVSGSQMVLDDIVGKKVVFRSGWEKASTYLLYNFRDEGDGGWLFRENLRTSIPVEEEKMHHGHSDENSIVLLMRNNSILLHDGGYRDYMPSGPFGAFRADYYHNRLAIRDGKITVGQKEGQYRYSVPSQAAVPGQSMLGFFRNSGAYRPVRTLGVDFLTLDAFDMTRTRIVDEHLGYEADRMITSIRPLNWFVVFDVVRFTKDTYLTMANLWHTQHVLASGPGWYVTRYDSLRGEQVAGRDQLLIHFPVRAQLEEGMETQDRYYQKEHVLYQLIGRHGYPNDLQAFVTVLVPHDSSTDALALLGQIRMLEGTEYPRAVGVRVSAGTTDYVVGAKLDMRDDLVADWRRPMYTYQSGRAAYGEYETDGHALFAVERPSGIDYTMVGGTRILHRGRLLHEQQPVASGLRFDGSAPGSGTGKVRYWKGSLSR